MTHEPREWSDELNRIISHSKGKGWKADILKLAAVEIKYEVGRFQNDKCFSNSADNTKIVDSIIYMIMYRKCYRKRLRPHMARLMV
ncbi:unnamed protein product [Lathyrus sativus]|nr:unnamed protein product [Lathyrus sativus]